MYDENELVEVVNFSGMVTTYSVPEFNVYRSFEPWESKKVSLKELRALAYLPGGLSLLKNYLSVHGPEEFLDEIGIEPVPEYYWTKQDIVELLTNGSVDQLLDCLDFAPRGMISTLRDLAVELEINDMNKREAIQGKTGFNITKAIEFKRVAEEADAEVQESRKDAPKRRVPVE